MSADGGARVQSSTTLAKPCFTIETRSDRTIAGVSGLPDGRAQPIWPRWSKNSSTVAGPRLVSSRQKSCMGEYRKLAGG